MKKALKQSTLVLLLNAVSVFLLLCIAAGFVAASVINTRIETSQTNRFDLTFNANRFMNGSKYLTNEVRAYAATSNQVHYDNYWNEVNTLKNRDLGIQAMKDIGITVEEQQMIDSMLNLSNQLVPLEEQAMNNVQQNASTQAIQAVYGEQYAQELSKISALQAQFSDTIEARTLQEVSVLNKTKKRIDLTIYLFLITIVVFQLLNYFSIRKSVIKPISLIQTQMGQMAKGDLSAMLNLEPNTSEIGQLVFSIQTMQASLRAMIEDLRQALSEIANRNFDITLTADFQGDFIILHDSLESIASSLSETLRDINQAADQVSSGSNQVSSGAMALSQGATEQASSVEELAAAITEISQQIQTSAQHAHHASQKANQVGSEAAESNDRMQAMLNAMDAISNSSSEIGKIIKAIEDIAFQTNILALNAAVEAARAGAAGKGFAVVADEVRNLASKSAEASKSTATLIAESLDAVKNGTKIADETAQSLGAVVSGVHDVNDTIDLISKALREQAQATSEVTVSVDQISSVVHTTSATSEESAATSEELSGQAALLKQLVANFKLRQNDDSKMLAEIPHYIA